MKINMRILERRIGFFKEVRFLNIKTFHYCSHITTIFVWNGALINIPAFLSDISSSLCLLNLLVIMRDFKIDAERKLTFVDRLEESEKMSEACR